MVYSRQVGYNFLAYIIKVAMCCLTQKMNDKPQHVKVLFIRWSMQGHSEHEARQGSCLVLILALFLKKRLTEQKNP